MRLAGTAAWALLAACTASATTGDPSGRTYAEANGYFAQGRYSEASPLYESVIAVRAVETLEKVLRVDRQDEYALRHLWRLYCHRGFPDQALAMAGGLAELYPRDRGLQDEIARLRELKGK